MIIYILNTSYLNSTIVLTNFVFLCTRDSVGTPTILCLIMDSVVTGYLKFSVLIYHYHENINSRYGGIKIYIYMHTHVHTYIHTIFIVKGLQWLH